MRNRIAQLLINLRVWLFRLDGCEYHKGCKKRGIPFELDGAHYYYCLEHAHDGGFCYMCGAFWAGIESFDFRRNRLCDYCDDAIRVDSGEFDEEEEAWC